MAILPQVEAKLQQIAELCKRYEVRELSVFGSATREDFNDESDIDLLVEFLPDANIGLFEYEGLRLDLEDALGRRVDLVSKSGLKPLIRDEILGSSEPLYAG
jgi:predicted nucleotidyltransferase